MRAAATPATRHRDPTPWAWPCTDLAIADPTAFQ